MGRTGCVGRRSHIDSRGVDRASYASGAAFVDGSFVPVAEARVPILDWGFLRSDATYDVAHLWRGSFFRLEDHLDRFERSMARLHLRSPTGATGSGRYSSSARASAACATRTRR